MVLMLCNQHCSLSVPDSALQPVICSLGVDKVDDHLSSQPVTRKLAGVWVPEQSNWQRCNLMRWHLISLTEPSHSRNILIVNYQKSCLIQFHRF